MLATTGGGTPVPVPTDMLGAGRGVVDTALLESAGTLDGSIGGREVAGTDDTACGLRGH